VEGLAAVAREDAEAELVKIGKAEEEPEELRKAAWRGLRRSKRARLAGRKPGQVAGRAAKEKAK
jgi:ParB family chromosome partitioning protein